MNWIRMGVFTTLTLVATTLPAVSAAPAPPRSEAQPAQPAAPGQPVEAEHSGSSRSEQAPEGPGMWIQAAPQMDVWKSAPTRPLGNPGPQLLAATTQHSAPNWKPSPSLGQDLQSHAARVHEHAREWLNCRYPNAPPTTA